MAPDADAPGLRAHVDDAAGALREHVPPGRLTGEEQATDVDVHQLVPLGLGHVERIVVGADPGVVAENVDRPNSSTVASTAARMRATSSTSIAATVM
jgi:hypothetical protein